MLGGKVTRMPRPKGHKSGFTKAAGIAHGVAPQIAHREDPTDPDGPSANSCGVCSGGLVSILVAIPDDQLGAHYKPGATRTYAYRCLCAFGQRKNRFVFGPDVGAILPREAIDELFPNGVPTVSVHGDNPAAVLERAGVPPACAGWTFSTYQDKFKSAEQQKFMRRGAQWVGLELAERPDVVMFGQNGTGKTGLAIAMLRAAMEGNERVLFWTLKLLATRWRGTYGRKTEEGRATSPEEDMLATLLNADVLVLDEIGGTKLSEFVEDTLTMIVDLRQKNLKPTILTVNTAADDGEPSQAMAAILGPALFDRLRERGQLWPMVGKSARASLKL